MDNKKTGEIGEHLAEQMLVTKGYKILKKNFSCPFGEIDLIALKKDTLAFIEVKTRMGDAFGTGREAVGTRKKRHIRNSANYYISASGLNFQKVDFQVIEVFVSHIEGLDF